MQSTQGIPPSAGAAALGRPSALTIRVGDQTYTVQPHEAPIVIGRDTTARIRIDDERISRVHARLDHSRAGWLAVDQGRNGIFLDGMRQPQIPITGTTTIHLGHPHGIAVSFTETIADPQPRPDTRVDPDDTETTMVTETTDPGVARAGAAVAMRRKELDLTLRYFPENGIMSQGSLTALEKGRSWPRRATRAKLEEALGWPQGHIAAIRHQRVQPDDEQTMALTNTMRAPLMTDVVELALDTITSAITDLPAPSEPEFTPRASRILGDLRRIEASAARAARAATGDPSVARILGAVRKTYKDLMLRAARAPGATLGQRLFAARHRAELTIEEMANAAGVPVEVISAAEADAPLDGPAVAALSAALTSLGGR
ncbi:FHA domain-containing protein [Mycobacterium heidelbergense]|uniref:FHA domain-containing protein n=1 Tax=Mycobacterium heidelbergense TaxID=53376 RepID=UPI003CFAA19E